MTIEQIAKTVTDAVWIRDVLVHAVENGFEDEEIVQYLRETDAILQQDTTAHNAEQLDILVSKLFYKVSELNAMINMRY